MTTLPDPRRYAVRGAPDRLLELVRASLATGDPIARAVHDDAVVGELRAGWQRGDDRALEIALAAATGPAEYAHLLARARDATEPALSPGEVAPRLFALPLVIVAGGASGTCLSGALPDVAGVESLLAEHAALGDVQRFSIGNALCAATDLESMVPGALARAQSGPQAPAALAALAGGFQPAPIELEDGEESIHLRFLVGAAWLSSEARRWVRPGDPVGRWATPLTHLLAKQLAQPEATVLPLARAPLPLAHAPAVGRAAAADAQFQLFVAAALRRARATTGEPTAILAAHRSELANGPAGEVRVTLSSPFDAGPCEAWTRTLEPGDDLPALCAAIDGFLQECRVSDRVLVPQVMPDRHPARPAERLLLAVADLESDGPAAAPLAH